MRGHWISQTRKLNRHYQSGGRAGARWKEQPIFYHVSEDETQFGYGYIGGKGPRLLQGSSTTYWYDGRLYGGPVYTLQPLFKRYKLRWKLKPVSIDGAVINRFGIIFIATGSAFIGLPDLMPGGSYPSSQSTLQNRINQVFVKDLYFAYSGTSGDIITDVQNAGRTNTVFFDEAVYQRYANGVYSYMYPMYSSDNRVNANLHEIDGINTGIILPDDIVYTYANKELFLCEELDSDNLSNDIILDYRYLGDAKYSYASTACSIIPFNIYKNQYETSPSQARPLYFGFYADISGGYARLVGDIWIEAI